MSYRLAPNAIVRAAGWPLSSISALADDGLAGSAARIAGDVGPVKEDAAYRSYEAAYAETIERQRSHLYRVTVGDPRFVRALTVTNPTLGERLESIDATRPRNKRARHNETTLYRYLARAVGRTEPCDLWAGATLAEWAPRTEVTAVASVHSFTPELRPFQSLVRALRRLPRYRRAGVWKANVTLRRTHETTWSFWARLASGHFVAREIRGSIELDLALEQLVDARPDRFDALCALAAARTSLPPHEWESVLEQLAERGALVGGLDLPSRFESPWHALEQVGQNLDAVDRPAWWRCYLALRRLCRRLGNEIDQARPADLRARYAEGADILRRLAGELGVSCPPLPRVALRCDWRLPFDIRLGPELEGRAQRALTDYLGALRTYGIIEPLRRLERGRLLGQTGRFVLGEADFTEQERLRAPEASESWQSLGRCLGAGQLEPGFDGAVSAWEALLHSESERVTLPSGTPAAGAPHGCFLFGATRTGLAVHGVFDEVLSIHARFAQHARTRSPDPLVRWYEAELRRLESAHGILIADLVSPFETNPNVLARPTVTRATIDLWAASRDEVLLRSAELRRAPGGAPLLHVPALDAPLVVYALASGNMALGDPLAQALLQTSFRLTPVVAAFQGNRVHFASELAGDRRSPEVVLSTGDVVRPSRTVLGGEKLQDLARAPAARRFALWQRAARKGGWGPILFVHRADEPPMLVMRDSPLAIEALFEGVRDRITQITIDEAHDEAWLEDDQGERYRTEFVVPFVRPACSWDTEADGARMAPDQRAFGEAPGGSDAECPAAPDGARRAAPRVEGPRPPHVLLHAEGP